MSCYGVSNIITSRGLSARPMQGCYNGFWWCSLMLQIYFKLECVYIFSFKLFVHLQFAHSNCSFEYKLTSMYYRHTAEGGYISGWGIGCFTGLTALYRSRGCHREAVMVICDMCLHFRNAGALHSCLLSLVYLWSCF